MEKLYNRIICPIDFSDYSAAATKRGAEIARTMESELYAAHIIINPLSKIYGDNIVNKVAKIGIEKIVEERMQKFLDEQSLGIPCKILFKQANHVYQGIIDFVEEHKIDLITIATHGRTGLKKFLLGSTADTIIQRAPCSVLVVRV